MTAAVSGATAPTEATALTEAAAVALVGATALKQETALTEVMALTVQRRWSWRGSVGVEAPEDGGGGSGLWVSDCPSVGRRFLLACKIPSGCRL